MALGAVALYSVLMLAVPVPDANGVVAAAGVLEPGATSAPGSTAQLLGGHLWAASAPGTRRAWSARCRRSARCCSACSPGAGWPRGAAAEKTVWMLLAGLALLWAGALLDAC
jgi:hypothetical protein